MRGTAMLFYRRLASPLHAARAWVGAVWAAALATAALVVYHPLVLVVLVLAILGAGAGAGVGRELLRALRTAAIVALPIVLINVLVSRDGLTVFARLGDLGPFGQGNLTVEAVVYGALIALKVTLLVLITTLASLAIDPDELLTVFRRFSFRSALTASLATRMVPVLGADAARLAEAQRTRPEGAPRGARGRVAVIAAVVAGSLDRAMDVAATLELRGFAAANIAPAALGQGQGAATTGAEGQRAATAARAAPRRGGRARTRAQRQPFSRHDLAFLLSALAVLVLALAGRLSDAAAFDAYPTVHAPVHLGTLLLCAGLLLAVLLPLADRRGIAR